MPTKLHGGHRDCADGQQTRVGGIADRRQKGGECTDGGRGYSSCRSGEAATREIGIGEKRRGKTAAAL